MEVVDKAELETEQKISENRLNIGNELRQLGFTKASENILSNLRLKEKINNITKYKYLKITDSMINDYLDTKVKNYNNLHKTEEPRGMFSYPNSLLSTPVLYPHNNLVTYVCNWNIPVTVSNEIRHQKLEKKTIIISKLTCDLYSNKKDTIGQFVWKECPVEEYEGIPPKEVLNKLRVHKDRLLFDYFTIASVENIKDPLLFGRITNSTDRYFIAHWGEDVLLDDLI